MRASATMAMRQNSSLAGAESPRLKPAAQRQVRLVAQAEPGKLNHGVPQATIARLGNPLIPFDAAALPGAAGKLAGGPLLGVGCRSCETTIQPEERCELRAHALELEEVGGGVVPPLGVRADERIAGPFDRSQCVAPPRSDRVLGVSPPSTAAATHGRRRFAAPRAVRNRSRRSGL